MKETLHNRPESGFADMKVILEVRSPEAEQRLAALREEFGRFFSHFQEFAEKIDVKLNILHDQNSTLDKRMTIIMATLDDVLADVTQESTDLDSISALIAGLKQQIADALAGVTLPPATQAKVDAIFTGAETNKGKIATALAANVPPAMT